MNDLLTRQQAIDKASKLNAVQPTGLVPARYTRADLQNIEELLVHVASAARFGRIDHAIYMNQLIDEEARRQGLNGWERDQRVYSSYCRLAARYGIKPETLKSEVSTMKQWPYHDRIEGLTVGHYRVIPSQMPRDLALQYLVDAAEGEWSVAELQCAVYEALDSARVEQAQPIQNTPATQPEQPPNGWAMAERFIARHEIERIHATPNRVVLHSASGALILESDTPIRYSMKETQP